MFTMNYSQNKSVDSKSVNNKVYLIKRLKSSQKVKCVFYKNADTILNVKYQNSFVTFFNDSIVIFQFCQNGISSLIKFAQKNMDSLELYGTDRYLPTEKKLTFKYPYIRKFKHYTFSYNFAIKIKKHNVLILKCKKPYISIKLKYYREYSDAINLLCQ